jgi:hypothetical protein
MAEASDMAEASTEAREVVVEPEGNAVDEDVKTSVIDVCRYSPSALCQVVKALS